MNGMAGINLGRMRFFGGVAISIAAATGRGEDCVGDCGDDR
jgi:hypothetical protein